MTFGSLFAVPVAEWIGRRITAQAHPHHPAPAPAPSPDP